MMSTQTLNPWTKWKFNAGTIIYKWDLHGMSLSLQLLRYISDILVKHSPAWDDAPGSVWTTHPQRMASLAFLDHINWLNPYDCWWNHHLLYRCNILL